MLSYWSDKLACLRIQAKYERLLRERMMELLERQQTQPVAEEAADWRLLGQHAPRQTPAERAEQRRQARRMVLENPHARNILRLLEAYVVGEGLQLTFASCPASVQESGCDAGEMVSCLWQEFLDANRGHFSYVEYARRVWRDGECFLRIFPQSEWPPRVRFIDPEWIDSPSGSPESGGIETEPGDIESPRAYLKVSPVNGELQERIPAEEILHTKYGTDSNEKRGRSFFASILEPLERFLQWQETELQARKLQASIVLWRRVQGGPAQARAVAEGAQGGSDGRLTDPRHERIRPGTILTTSAGTEIKYLQPDTNFGDAVPLGRMILLGIAAGAGIPEFMLTSDAANGNYASTMVAEGPAVKLFQSEQRFFTRAFTALWREVMSEAERLGLLGPEQLAQVESRWSYPELISRDRPRERQADVELIRAGVLSRAEVQRREQLDPRTMRTEIASEREHTDPERERTSETGQFEPAMGEM